MMKGVKVSHDFNQRFSKDILDIYQKCEETYPFHNIKKISAILRMLGGKQIGLAVLSYR